MSRDVHDDDERDSEAEITDLRAGALALFREAEWSVDGLTLIVVRDGSERDLDEDSPCGEALPAHLVEISGPLAIVKRISSRVVVGVTNLDAVAVRGHSSSTAPAAARAILARLRSAAARRIVNTPAARAGEPEVRHDRTCAPQGRKIELALAKNAVEYAAAPATRARTSRGKDAH